MNEIESVHSSIDDMNGNEMIKMKELKQVLAAKDTPLTIKIIRVSMLIMTILLFTT